MSFMVTIKLNNSVLEGEDKTYSLTGLSTRGEDVKLLENGTLIIWRASLRKLSFRLKNIIIFRIVLYLDSFPRIVKVKIIVVSPEGQKIFCR